MFGQCPNAEATVAGEYSGRSDHRAAAVVQALVAPNSREQSRQSRSLKMEAVLDLKAISSPDR